MVNKISICILLASILLAGCKNETAKQRDLVLEVASLMSNLYDIPHTHAKELYERYCSVCHGINGQGDGFNAFNLSPRPRNFTDSSFITRMDTNLVMETISGGGRAVGLSPLMPKWGNTLTKREIENLTEYIFFLSQRN